MSKKKKKYYKTNMNTENKNTENQTANTDVNAQATPNEVADETQTGAEEQAQQPTEETTPENSKSEELLKLEQRCADLADKNLRMMAEFDNYRRRTAKEKLNLQKTAGEKIFVDMLPLIDDFERALNAINNSQDVDSLKQGVELIYNKFIGFLDKQDVHQIATTDAVFDTSYHEAITTFPAPTQEQKGKVIDCTQKGYTLGDKVIRYAKVVVGE